MALTTVDFNTYFDYKLATKQIRFTDKTDFVGQGTTTSNVTVVVKNITAPISGTIYTNTNHGAPDIDPNVSLDSTIVIPLPLDAGSLPEQGLYSITLEYQDLIVGPATVEETRTFTLNYTEPTISLTPSVDCISPLISIVDNTVYTVNTVEPTITSRAFSMAYPSSLNPPVADVTGTAGTLTTNIIYTVANEILVYSTSLTTNVSYLFNVADSMYVIDEITGSKFFNVTCDGDLCDIYCCIRSQYERYETARETNATLAVKELEKFKQITSIAEMIGIALKCGKSTHVSEYTADILRIAECDAGCACADGVPALVTGLGITGDTIVVDAGTGITVTSVSGGGTTTYTVALSATNVTKLANLFNTIPVAGSGVTVSAPVVTTVSGVTTNSYTITATDSVVESLFVRSLLTFSSGVVPVPTITNQKEYGVLFATVNQGGGTEFLLNNNNASYSDWATNYANFTVGNFFTTPGSYWPSVEIVNIAKPSESPGGITSYVNDLVVEIISMSASSFQIRFVDAKGNPVNGAYLQNYSTLELIFKIQA